MMSFLQEDLRDIKRDLTHGAKHRHVIYAK